MEIDLGSPLTIGLNALAVAALVGSLVVVWNARRSKALLCFALLFSGAVAGVYVPFFAVMAAITVTVTDRRKDEPPVQHGPVVTRVLRHFRGRPDPEPAGAEPRSLSSR